MNVPSEEEACESREGESPDEDLVGWLFPEFDEEELKHINARERTKKRGDGEGRSRQNRTDRRGMRGVERLTACKATVIAKQ